MNTEKLILRPDDFELGMLVTVLDGDCCPEGCCEAYKPLKGVPLVILDVNLPYIVCGLPRGMCTHLDVRDCDLMRVQDSYAKYFGIVRQPPAEAAPEGPELPQWRD